MIALELKIAYTVMVVAVLVPYWFRYGWRNYLWFSDVALILLVPALWLESAWVASTVAVGTLALELFWNVSFAGRLFGPRWSTGLTDYMFEPARPLWLRALSLFHMVVPAVTLLLLFELGYDPRALPTMLVLGTAVLVTTYAVTAPEQNINWVRGFGTRPQTRMPPRRYLLLLLVAFPLLVWIPSHFVLAALFGQ
jgi:hypothetical protein